MKTVVVVEDDEWKRDQLVEVIRKHFSDEEVVVVVARSVSTGLKAIVDGADLVLLDMSLPTFEGTGMAGGRPQGFGGQEILNQLHLRGIHVPVIVVTQHGEFSDGDRLRTLSELESELARTAGENFAGAIRFSSVVSGWRDDLVERIRSIQESKI